jgi:hypothetical protein
MTFKRFMSWMVSMTARRRKALLGLLLAGLAAWMGWGVLQRTPAGAAASRFAAAPAAAASAGAVMPVERGASASGVALSMVAASGPDDARAELARRMKADWCGFGAAETERQTEAVYANAIAKTGMIGMEARAEVRDTVGGQLMEEAMADVRRRWVQALTRRVDERSLAMAGYLDGDGSGDAAAAARAQLQARARKSTDAMVTALALQRPCAVGACVNVEASQWSRLEPANLQAWLALVNSPSRAAEQTQAAYALDRVAQEVRYCSSYQREAYALLMSLPQTETPGLQNEAEMQLAGSVVFGWLMPRMRPVIDLCRHGQADTGVAPRCEAVAQLLLQQEDSLNRSMGLSIARALVAVRPGVRPQWEAQAREYEAVREWQRMAVERAASQPEPESPASMSRCAGQPEMRQFLRDFMTRGEWTRMRDGMNEAGVDEATLAAGWRKRQERSELDPLPVSQPASAPARAN